MRTSLQSLGALFIGFSALAFAHEYTVGDLFIDHPWARPLPAVAKNGAAYLRIENRGTEMDRLLGASTPIAAKAELHTHVHEQGVMKMRPVEAIEVPPGGSVAIEPGGLHVMLMGLEKPLVEGEEFPLQLRFERAGTVEVTVKIEEPGEGGTEHAGHGDHDTHGTAD